MKATRILSLGLAMAASLMLVTQAHAAVNTITSAKLTLSNSVPTATGVTYTFTYTHPGANNVQAIGLKFCTTASDTCVNPDSLNFTAATKGTFVGLGTDGHWTNTINTAPDMAFVSSQQENVVAGAVTIPVQGIVNPTGPATNGCSANGVNNSASTCYVRYTDYSVASVADQTKLLDQGTFTFTIVSEVTVTARVDPTFTFVVQSVAANAVNNQITTSVASTFDTLPFGNLTAGTPKYAAHALYVTTNTQGGYTVDASVTTQMTGVYAANNIDPFIATWSSPAAWTEPTGQTPNDNTGWLGANTTDTDVGGWNSTPAGKFGGLPTSTAVTVSKKNTSDNGSAPVYVTYAIEANVFQPADAYTGKLMYNALPTY